MAVLESDIMIDMHATPDADVDSIRGAVQENSRLRPGLAGEFRRIIEGTTTEVLEAHDITDCSLTVEVELVQDRVPGAPRERINARLGVEGDKSALASVQDAFGAPERAQIAEITEKLLKEHLGENDLADVVDTRVIVTPIQFR